MGVFIDLKGMKFGKWTALESIGKGKWKCECECGTLKDVVGSTLRGGKSRSCGCASIKHGYEGSKVYRLWSYMKERCFNENHKSWEYYGGRGITVCEEWLEAKAFIEWCLNNGYKEGLTIDRIDVNSDYCPSNCRFISNLEQQRNKRNSKYITINGITKVAAEWSEITGLCSETIIYRYNKGERGSMLLRKGRKGGGFDEDDTKRYFNKKS